MRRALVILLGIAAAGCVATPIPLPLAEGGAPVGKLDADHRGDRGVKGPPDAGGPQLHMDAAPEGRDDGRDGAASNGKDGLTDGAADAGRDGLVGDGPGFDGLPPAPDGLAATDGLAPPAQDGLGQKKDGP